MLGAESEGMIGYMLEQELRNARRDRSHRHSPDDGRGRRRRTRLQGSDQIHRAGVLKSQAQRLQAKKGWREGGRQAGGASWHRRNPCGSSRFNRSSGFWKKVQWLSPLAVAAFPLSVSQAAVGAWRPLSTRISVPNCWAERSMPNAAAGDRCRRRLCRLGNAIGTGDPARQSHMAAQQKLSRRLDGSRR